MTPTHEILSGRADFAGFAVLQCLAVANAGPYIAPITAATAAITSANPSR